MVFAIASGSVCFIAFILTLLTIGMNLVTGTGPNTIAQFTVYIAGPILILRITLLYIKIARTSSGTVKKTLNISPPLSTKTDNYPVKA